MRTSARSLICSILLSVVAADAHAEVSKVRIAHQFGLGYLPLYVMREKKLISECAKEAGAGDVAVEWSTVGSTAIMADGIISGNFDIASAGVPPFIILWDRTKGRVKMISALNEQPMKLNTNNPNVKSLADLGDQDRIAVPSVKTSAHSILLGMAAEKIWGPGNGGRLESMQVPLSHPDATAALISGGGQVTAHFSTAPFTAMQLASPNIRTILTLHDVVDGSVTTTAWWTTAEFRDANPKIFSALMCAAERAGKLIEDDRREAAAIYKRVEGPKLSLEEIEAILADPEMKFTNVPQNTMAFADFMSRTGLTRTPVKSWQDLFFPEAYKMPGS